MSGGWGNLCGQRLDRATFRSQGTSNSLGGGRILPEALGKVMSNGHLELPGLQGSAQPQLPLQGPAPSLLLRVRLLGCLLTVLAGAAS